MGEQVAGFGGLVRTERESIPWTQPEAARELSSYLGEHCTVKRWRWIEGRADLPERRVFLAVCALFEWVPEDKLRELRYSSEYLPCRTEGIVDPVAEAWG